MANDKTHQKDENVNDVYNDVIEGEELEWIESPGGWGSQDHGGIEPSSRGGNSADHHHSSSPQSEGIQPCNAGQAGDREPVENDRTRDGNDHDSEEDASSDFLDLFAYTNSEERFTFEFDTKAPCLEKTCAKESKFDSDSNQQGVYGEAENVSSGTRTRKKITLHGYKLDSDETAQSTGVTLWQAAPRLAHYLVDNFYDIAPFGYNGSVRIVELGAGLGLCGIVAFHLAFTFGESTNLQVILTDGDTSALKQMRHNVLLNCAYQTQSAEGMKNHTNQRKYITCRQLLWGNQRQLMSLLDLQQEDNQKSTNSSHRGFDLILGADVIYSPESLEPLFDTANALLRRPHLNSKATTTKEETSTTKEVKASRVAPSVTSALERNENAAAAKGGGGQFILSRHTRWNNVSDAIVLETAMRKGLSCNQPEENIYVFSCLED